MPNRLIIDYPDSNEFAIVYPVPRDRIFAFDLASTQLRERWMRNGFNTQALIDSDWWLISKIAGMLRSDPDFPFAVSRLRADIESIQRLFLINPGDDGSLTEIVKDEFGNALTNDNGEPVIRLRASQLLALHLFEPRKAQAKDPDAPIDPPFPTSGDPDCDILANLMGPFGVEGAFLIYRTCDQKTIEDILFSYNELQKPLDDRRQEYVAKLFYQEMERPEYRRSLLEDW